MERRSTGERLGPSFGFFVRTLNQQLTWTTFVETIGNLRYSEWPSDLERARLWYEPHLERIHEDAEVRRADLVQLEQIASGYPSRERFLTDSPWTRRMRSATRRVSRC